MADAVHLVKVPLSAAKVAALVRARGLPARDLDEGYLCHWVLREVFGDLAPAPFVLRGQGRVIEAWGYSSSGHEGLIDHARAFADPSVLALIPDLRAVHSRPMPVFEAGRRVGFHLRACPVVRLSRALNGHRAGAEVDAFLAHCFKVGPDVVADREAVYRDWLTTRFGKPGDSGAAVESVRVAGMSRERLLRRMQDRTRTPKRLERTDVRFEGTLVVSDGERLLGLLRRGVGRHRAFGFGALMIVPPGQPYSA